MKWREENTTEIALTATWGPTETTLWRTPIPISVWSRSGKNTITSYSDKPVLQVFFPQAIKTSECSSADLVCSLSQICDVILDSVYVLDSHFLSCLYSLQLFRSLDLFIYFSHHSLCPLCLEMMSILCLSFSVHVKAKIHIEYKYINI